MLLARESARPRGTRRHGAGGDGPVATWAKPDEGVMTNKNAGLAVAAAALLAAVAAVYCAERPLLLLLQLLQPLQTRAIEAITAEGYKTVRTPGRLQDALSSFVREEGAVRRWRRYEGNGESIEDPIISGVTEVLHLPPALKQHARAALLPLAERFCDCRLEHTATVYGVRVYRAGARLVPHLDWPDRWVVSATLCVEVNGSARGGWPLELRSYSGEGGEVVQSAGDAVLYEGSRMMHGRPEPFDGDVYAGVFVGYTPVGYPDGARRFSTRIAVRGVRAVKRALRLVGVRL